MKQYLLLGMAATATLLVACGGEEAKQAEPKLDTLEEKVSYIVGYNMASQAKANNFEVDVNALTMAMQDAQSDKESRLSQEESQAAMTAFQTQQQAKQQEAMTKQAEENKQEGEAYLAEYGQKEGVTTTESGLQYREITDADGPSPTAEDEVTVHYTGRLIDGTVFDSSVERGQPATFPVNGVIPGWVEALQLMEVGDKWEIVIPSELAYGPGGTSGPIGPNETLIFEVELLDINNQAAEGAQQGQAQSKQQPKQQ
jgi:FKBP-type peptidyl-prolyl cis-trans isomerase